jgi:hypothetical protein
MGTQRTGVPSILLTAERMCKLLAAWTPTIKTLFPGATALHDALDAAAVACAALAAELELVREYGD